MVEEWIMMERINFSENISVSNHTFHLQTHTEGKHIVFSLFENGVLLSKQSIKADFTFSAKRVFHEQVYEKHQMIKKGILHLFQQYKSIELIDSLSILFKIVFLFTQWKLYDESLGVLTKIRKCLRQFMSSSHRELLMDHIAQMEIALYNKNYEKALAMLKLMRKELILLNPEILQT